MSDKYLNPERDPIKNKVSVKLTIEFDGEKIYEFFDRGVGYAPIVKLNNDLDSMIETGNCDNGFGGILPDDALIDWDEWCEYEDLYGDVDTFKANHTAV